MVSFVSCLGIVYLLIHVSPYHVSNNISCVYSSVMKEWYRLVDWFLVINALHNQPKIRLPHNQYIYCSRFELGMLYCQELSGVIVPSIDYPQSGGPFSPQTVHHKVY